MEKTMPLSNEAVRTLYAMTSVNMTREEGIACIAATLVAVGIESDATADYDQRQKDCDWLSPKSVTYGVIGDLILVNRLGPDQSPEDL